MKSLARPAGWLVVVMLGLSVAQTRETWIHAQTEHFEMFSCASERESKTLLQDLERFRQVFLSIFDLSATHEPPCIQRRFLKMRNKARVLVYFAIMRWRVKDFATAREIADVLMIDEKKSDPASQGRGDAVAATAAGYRSRHVCPGERRGV